jgi:hypothetical protein
MSESIAHDNNKTSTASPSTKPKDSNKHIYEKAYYKGYRDFLHGKLDDPYRKNSLLSKEWQRGQNAAYFKNLEFLRNGSLLRNHFNRKKKSINKSKHS